MNTCDITALVKKRDSLRDIKASGVKSVAVDGQSVVNDDLANLAGNINDLNNQIAIATGVPSCKPRWASVVMRHGT